MQRAGLAIVVGGVTGATTRWAVGELGWSATTALMVVNALGCLALGYVVVRWPERSDPRRLGLGVGFCGGLTTFSSLAVDVAQRLDAGDASAAPVLVGAMAIGGLAYGFGRRLGGTPA